MRGGVCQASGCGCSPADEEEGRGAGTSRNGFNGAPGCLAAVAGVGMGVGVGVDARCGGDATSRSTVLSKLVSAADATGSGGSGSGSGSCLRLDDEANTPSWNGEGEVDEKRGATRAGLYPGPDPVMDEEVLDREACELADPGAEGAGTGTGAGVRPDAGVGASVRVRGAGTGALPRAPKGSLSPPCTGLYAL
jgi:hypothetical protein